MREDQRTPRRAVTLAIIVAALGYFVDIYDLVLFGIVRVESLIGLGVPEEELLSEGVFLLNMQMGGMLVGGILWGILGDKRGRLSVLFGSIFIYSAANIANGFVESVEMYAVLRVIAGIGLAGELGAGITLVSELMPAETRGYGTTIVATVGILGAVAAALVGDSFEWRTAYFVGGGMGLVLLILRIGVYESGMFARLKQRDVPRGDILALLKPGRLKRYASIILIGVPIWYAVAVLVTFSPEMGRAMGMTEVPVAGTAIMLTYIGLSAGDFGSGWLSQIMKTRKKVVKIFLFITIGSIVLYFVVGHISLTFFYTVCFLIGFATGYWAVFVTMASEQFGTNLRATVTTTAPNFVRGSVVPVTMLFHLLQGWVGMQMSAVLVGLVVLAVAFVALSGLEETFGKDLDFVEE